MTTRESPPGYAHTRRQRSRRIDIRCSYRYLVAAVMPQPVAAARRTTHPLEHFLPAVPYLSEVVAFLTNVEYQYRAGGRETGALSDH